jgi:NADH-quinone oxidoreductase subunit E
MFYEDHKQQIDELISRYPNPRGACLPLLWLAQDKYGYLTDDAMEEIAEILDLALNDLEGVASFYTMYFRRPVGRHLIWVCRTLSCSMLGSGKLLDHLKEKLGVEVGETTPDGRFTLLTQECLAACGEGPVIQVDDKYHTHMTIEKVDALIEELSRDLVDAPVEEDRIA